MSLNLFLICLPFFLFFSDGQQSSGGLVSASAKSLSLNLKNHYSQTLDHLITSTPSRLFETSPLSPTQVGCAESYLNLLNMESGVKPPASANNDLDPFIRANGAVEDKEMSGNEIVPFTSRNSASMDEK